MDEHNPNILERIHASYYQLTAAERKVADFVLAQYEQVQFMSITQLADECGTADATVSRFCRSLELKGFNAFKLELARYSSPGGRAAQKRLPTKNSILSRSLEVGRVANDAIYQTIELVESSQIEKAVQLIHEAGRVISIGSGGSMFMAQEFAHLFSTVTGKVTAVVDSHLQMSAAATMSSHDVIVLFSYSGATTVGLQILEFAKSRGIKTILVTRFRKSPAATLADAVLCCGSNETPFQLGSVPAKIAQLVLMEILFQEYCFRNPEDCETSIQNIATALSSLHV